MSRFPQYGNVFGGASNTTGRNELVSFSAGKMNVRPSSNGKLLVTPDLKKGKVCLTRGDDQLLHFQWVDRQSGASQEDFIIFPNDAKFIKVNTGREGDRVYLLQYNNSTRRFFFWMQNKDHSKDEELTKKLNDSMNSATGGGASDEASGTGRSTGAGGNGNIQLDHNAIMQMLGAMGGGEGGRGGGTGNAGGNSAVQMADLQNILQNMGLPGSTAAATSPAPSVASSSGQTAQSVGASSAAATTASQQGDMDVDDDEMTEEELLRLAIAESMRDSAPDAGASQAAAATPSAPVSQPPASASSIGGGGITAADLERAMASIQSYAAPKKISITKLLSAENIAPLLNDQSVVYALLQHLPEGAQNEYELRETLHSPQFRQSIRSLVHALQSGNFNAVLASFGLDPNAGANKLAFGDGVGAFLDAILQGAKKKN